MLEKNTTKQDMPIKSELAEKASEDKDMFNFYVT